MALRHTLKTQNKFCHRPLRPLTACLRSYHVSSGPQSSHGMVKMDAVLVWLL